MGVEIMYWILFSGLVLYLIACGVMYFNQEEQVFLPEKLPESHQFHFDQDFEEIDYYPSEGVRINALHFKVEEPRGVIFYFHGNSGSLSNWGIIAGKYTMYGFDVLVFDYRQYGKSIGPYSEKGMFGDALYIYDDLSEKYGEQNIVVFGRSLGSGFATYVAAQRSPRTLVLETPYYSLLNLAYTYYPWLPHHILLKYRFRSDKYISHVDCPIHILHGEDDQVVYFGSSKKLLKKAKPNDELISIKEGRHSDLENYDEFHQAMRRILLTKERSA